MGRIAKVFHLICAVVASFTFLALSAAIGVVVVVLYRREMPPSVDPSKALFLFIPLIIVGAGALMEFRFYKEERDGIVVDENSSGPAALTAGLHLVSGKPQAWVAVGLTAWVFLSGLRSLFPVRPYSLMSPFSGLLPRWGVFASNLVFYCAFAMIAVGVMRAPSRRDEKALLLMFRLVPMLAPIAVLCPQATLALRYVQVSFELTALLAAISLLVFFHDKSNLQDLQEPPNG